MKTIKIVEKDVRKLVAEDLVVEVKEVVVGLSGFPVLINTDRTFVLIPEPVKSEEKVK